jgi:hypothetical protein
MKQMYIITLSTGSYTTYNTQFLFVTDNFEDGSSYVQKMNSLFQSMEDKLKFWQENDYKNWLSKNPRKNPDFIKKHYEFTQSSISSLLSPEEFQLYHSRDYNYWEIEPIDFLPTI